MTFNRPRPVRPYELMCTVCALGETQRGTAQDPRLADLLAYVRADPSRPLALVCNVSSDYGYQNAGTDRDTPEGALFNVKRDLDILQRMGLAPGATRPAVELFDRLLRQVPAARGLCGRQDASSSAWRGCSKADSGAYERARARGIEGVFPARDAGDRAAHKARSTRAIRTARVLSIRPHHLMCMSCYHAGRPREALEVLDGDNLQEPVLRMQDEPDVPVRLIQGCCMVCPPCPSYQPQTNRCLGGHGMALRDEKKDLDVLQLTGLTYGQVLPARELMRLVYERIPSTRLVCAYGDGVVRGPEWTICGGPNGSSRYAKARRAGLGIPGLAGLFEK